MVVDQTDGSLERTSRTAQTSEALSERLFDATIGAMEVASIYLGDRLGYYVDLASHGPSTPAEVAQRIGTDERYTREWLEQQAVAGILNASEATESAKRRFELPAGYAPVLADSSDLSYFPPFTRQFVGTLLPLADVVDAFRTGAGVPYASYGRDMREGISDLNGVMFERLLGSEWFPAIPELHQRLTADPPARVADFGCGTGRSSIAIARAYPRVHVDGFDLDHASVMQAQQNVQLAGLEDRVHIRERDAADIPLDERFDVACAFECVHDMADPVSALRTMRRLVGETGIVLIADERVAEIFTAPGEPTERLMYGCSVLHCLPVGRDAPASAATGTVMRPATLRSYARAAGFADVEIAPVDNDFWRFYLLR